MFMRVSPDFSLLAQSMEVDKGLDQNLAAYTFKFHADIIGPRCENTCLRGLRTTKAHTSLRIRAV